MSSDVSACVHDSGWVGGKGPQDMGVWWESALHGQLILRTPTLMMDMSLVRHAQTSLAKTSSSSRKRLTEEKIN